jgi:hypothetical protein
MCRVTLTTNGIKTLRQRSEVTFKHNFCQKDAVLETELWNIMAIFGDSLFVGVTESPFFENAIEVGV